MQSLLAVITIIIIQCVPKNVHLLFIFEQFSQKSALLQIFSASILGVENSEKKLCIKLSTTPKNVTIHIKCHNFTL